MQLKFGAAMAKLGLLGHSALSLLDCTEAIPLAKSVTKAATFPAGKTVADIEHAVSHKPPESFIFS